MRPKVSIIVPCYNVENYVSECLDSILKQTMKDIEVILLNDGSTDGTLSILKEYTNKDCRVQLYEHANRGLGPTRNRGIEIASGEYICFIDSDDYVSETMLEKLYTKAIIENADIVAGEVYVFEDGNFNNGKIRKQLTGVKSCQLGNNSKEEFFRSYYFSRIFSHNAWDKIYRRDMVLNYKMLFGDNKKIFAEDNWFQLQAFMANPKICFLDEVCYYYRQQTGSIMHKPKQNLLERHGQMVKDYLHLIESNGSHNSDLKTCALVAFDILIMELLNQKLTGGNSNDYLRSLEGIKEHSVLKDNICSITRQRAYTLEPAPKRRLGLRFVSYLYRIKKYNTAHKLMWKIFNYD